MNLITVNPNQCKPWQFADRSGFEYGDIYSLIQDLKKNGQIEPVLLRPHPTVKDKYEVIAGARRWKARSEANLPLKAIVQGLTDEQAAIAQLKENQQIPLCDYSKGISYDKMLKKEMLTRTHLAELIGCSRAKLSNFLAFADISYSLWDTVGNVSRVSSRTAATILSLQKKGEVYLEAMIDLAEEIKKGIGSATLEQKVLEIVQGKTRQIDYQKTIELPSGQVIATWEKNGLRFAKDVAIDQEQFNALVINFFEGQPKRLSLSN